MDIERLIDMANQIARNLTVRGDDEAAEATAEHIRAYWDSRMKAGILAARERDDLSPIARAALRRLLD